MFVRSLVCSPSSSLFCLPALASSHQLERPPDGRWRINGRSVVPGDDAATT